MKPVDVKWITYIDFNKENNKKDPKFNVGGYVRFSKYRNIFAKVYFPNWKVKKFLWLKKLKILFRGHMLLFDKKRLSRAQQEC